MGLSTKIQAALTALSDADKSNFSKCWDAIGAVLDELSPPGTIKMHGGGSAPTGYLLCDGSAVSRTTYADLFAVIGTTFGIGDGSNTFNLPDFRGIFPRGVGSNGTLTATGGALGTYQQDAMQRITGSFYSANLSSNNMVGNGVFTNVQPVSPVVECGNSAEGSEDTGYTFDSANSTSPNTAKTDDDETRPSNLTVHFIIKT